MLHTGSRQHWKFAVNFWINSTWRTHKLMNPDGRHVYVGAMCDCAPRPDVGAALWASARAFAICSRLRPRVKPNTNRNNSAILITAYTIYKSSKQFKACARIKLQLMIRTDIECWNVQKNASKSWVLSSTCVVGFTCAKHSMNGARHLNLTYTTNNGLHADKLAHELLLQYILSPTVARASINFTFYLCRCTRTLCSKINILPPEIVSRLRQLWVLRIKFNFGVCSKCRKWNSGKLY